MAFVKGKKMDPRLVSNQAWELQYIANKFKVTVTDVRNAKEEMQSRSRRKIYRYLRDAAAMKK